MKTLELDETQAGLLGLILGAHLHALRFELAITDEKLRPALAREIDALEVILRLAHDGVRTSSEE
jgi:hypothetical protein